MQPSKRVYVVMLWSGLLAVGCGACGKSAAGPDAPGTSPGDGAPLDVPGHTPGMPGLGAHGMSFYHLAANASSSISTPGMATQPSGSTIVVAVGRGDNSLFASGSPTDNKGNAPYQRIGDMHPYSVWPDSGTAVYAFPSATGGGGFTVSTTRGVNRKNGGPDEITLAAIEVIEGTRIQDFVWNEIPGTPAKSLSVTTTGPATLIALWWGDGYFYAPPLSQKAKPNNDFYPIEFNTQETDSFVQCSVAVKNVTKAGSYDVTWQAEPAQGAQLWLIAVQ